MGHWTHMLVIALLVLAVVIVVSPLIDLPLCTIRSVELICLVFTAILSVSQAQTVLLPLYNSMRGSRAAHGDLGGVFLSIRC